MFQDVKPLIVTIQREPAPSTSWADVIVGSLGVAGALGLLAVILGAVLGGLLVLLRRRREAADAHMPSVSPPTPLSSSAPGSRSRVP